MSALSSASRMRARRAPARGDAAGGRPVRRRPSSGSQRRASSTKGRAAGGRGRARAARADPVRRADARPAGNGHRERRARGPTSLVDTRPRRRAAGPAPGPGPARCPCPRGCAPRALDPVEPLEDVRQLGRRGCRCRCRGPSARTASPAGRSVTAISPSKVNLNALDRRLRTIFSHMSRSTKTGSQTAGSRRRGAARPARPPSGRRWPGRAVNAARSVGS